jgi:hypothetical protein
VMHSHETHSKIQFIRSQNKLGYFYTNLIRQMSRGSSVGIALGYGLDDQGSRIRFPAGAGNFSLRHRVQNSSGVHPASLSNVYQGLFPWG